MQKTITLIKQSTVRDYFFYIDHKGLLFLEETEPKNFTSCIKDSKFMEQFLKNLSRNNLNRYQKNYPFVSKCWGEFNFVRCFKTPIVYNDLIEQKYLIAASGYREQFDPTKLWIDQDGILHHDISMNDLGLGIFSSDLSLAISDFLIQKQDNWHFLYNESNYLIKKLLY